MTADTIKQALRAEARQRRDQGVPDRVAAARDLARLAADVYALAPSSAPVVSSYLAIGSELDPAPLAAALAARGATIALPVMAAKAAPLEFRAWAPGDPLVSREWGIREPAPVCPVVEPDLLLVPLLLVDSTGHRLGYGGGFYD
ncbi:MAG: 5-formyltetrahydrofolate cyclo-ligase, partial [Hyphomicrobiaceae bacterium]